MVELAQTDQMPMDATQWCVYDMAQKQMSAQWPCVAAEERSEAASGDEVVANPANAVCLKHRVVWFYDCSAAGRSLAPLLICYGIV